MGFADDHDPVGARHPAEPGQCGLTVGSVQQFENGGVLHLPMVQTAKAARQVPGGLSHAFLGPTYQRPREKKPSTARTRMMIRMIQRMFTSRPPFVVLLDSVSG